MNAVTAMRNLIKRKPYVVTPGVTNPLQAIIVERVGFDYVYMTGYGTSLTLLGLPDVGLLTETEMVSNARNIAKAVKVPVLADADTGFGNAINVIRTVEDYEAAGVAGIHIEDQVFPKRCGHVDGKHIVQIEEAVGKIRAAVEAKRNKEFIIIARTDAISAIAAGFNEAVKRGKAYADAGADMIFCEFPDINFEQPEKFAREVHKGHPDLPLFFNYSSSLPWQSSTLKFTDFAEMGYKVIIVSLACLRASMQAVWNYAADLLERKEQAEKDFQMQLRGHETEDFHKFAGFPGIREVEAKYLRSDKLRKKYKKSSG